MEALDPSAPCAICGVPTERAVVVSALLDPDDGSGLQEASTQVFDVCAAHWAEQVVAHRQALDLLGTVDRFAESGPVPRAVAAALAASISLHAEPGAA
ncbi:hypothetical protein [Tersicoccus sp. Bi-70]|uniref:hypothetical protein n=1 Tax=Tersicoccus sp. Bi-70 TaxID=1897634 RepID=UPI000977574E|nr:hypothetical protein [Tersicoccus sp. Bi-70]OMH36954.1 hypothetical protein BGP79_14635 [Tersicoccus sp. Bi-70]